MRLPSFGSGGGQPHTRAFYYSVGANAHSWELEGRSALGGGHCQPLVFMLGEVVDGGGGGGLMWDSPPLPCWCSALMRWSGLQGGGAVSLSAHYSVVYWGCSCDLVEVVGWGSFPPLPLPFPFLFIFPSPSLLLSSSVEGLGLATSSLILSLSFLVLSFLDLIFNFVDSILFGIFKL